MHGRRARPRIEAIFFREFLFLPEKESYRPPRKAITPTE
jgi:hypothetical protein